MNLNAFLQGPGRARRLAASVLVLLTVVFVAGWWLQSADAQAKASIIPAIDRSAAPLPRVGPVASYADVVSEVAPAVVTIRSERRVRATAYDEGDAQDFLRQFFGNQAPRMPRPAPRMEGALGSGVVVTNDGYILTNNHVVDGAQQITVELPDHRSFSARVVGTDPPSDLAVLKVDAANLPTVKLGDSDQTRVGDVVLAVGDPLGVGETVTMGIVSAKGRATGMTDDGFEDFIQTDAPINQGNSGGALVNTRGELIGINSQIMTPSGGSIGIGFAVPSRMAENVMQQIIKTGHVRRGMLGVTVQGVTSDMAKSLGLQDVHGAIVASVQAGGPAEKAGIQQGDVITALNGKPVNDSNSLRNEVAATSPGSRVTLDVVRDGRERKVDLALAQLPDKRESSKEGTAQPGRGRLGLTVEPLTPSLSRQLNSRAKSGLVVGDVTPGGPAYSAGIRSGDIIREVNRKPVTSASELQEAAGNSGGRPLLLLIERDGSTLFVAVAPSRG